MQVKAIIPNFITLCNLFCGFLALIQHDILMSVGFIALGMIFDVLDGLIARWLHAPSELGKQLDSLADMVTFGLAPAYLFFSLAENPRIGMIAAFILIAASALRLAKFNLKESAYGFEGLPTPASAAILLGIFIAIANEQGLVIDLIKNDFTYLLIPSLLAFFMVSSINMFSLKKGVLGIKENPGPVLCVLVLIVMIVLNKDMAVLITSLSYIFLSMILNVMKR